MTPADIAKSGTESGHQRALFAAVNQMLWQLRCQQAHLDVDCRRAFPECIGKWDHVDRAWAWPLVWLHAIPNGGSRGDDARSRAIRGATLKAEGVKEGIPDLHLPYPTKGFHGMYIEMKKPGGRVSEEQRSFGIYAMAAGYRWLACYSWEEALAALTEYLKP